MRTMHGSSPTLADPRVVGAGIRIQFAASGSTGQYGSDALRVSYQLLGSG
jgi:hypothetical protein